MRDAGLRSCGAPGALQEVTAHQNLLRPSAARDRPDAALPAAEAGEGDERAVRRPTRDAHLTRVQRQARQGVSKAAAGGRYDDLRRLRIEVDVDEGESLPSRDHIGCANRSVWLGLGLTRVRRPLPSGRTASKPLRWLAVQLKTIVRPSGDQAGCVPSKSVPCPRRRRLAPVPLTFTTHRLTPIPPGGSPPNASWRSPGPQLAPEQSVLTWPTCWRPVPSPLITKRWQKSSRRSAGYRTNAICVPSATKPGTGRWRSSSTESAFRRDGDGKCRDQRQPGAIRERFLLWSTSGPNPKRQHPVRTRP